MDRHFLGISLALMTGVSWGIVSLSVNPCPSGHQYGNRYSSQNLSGGCGLWALSGVAESPVPSHFPQRTENILIYGILSVVFTYTGFLFPQVFNCFGSPYHSLHLSNGDPSWWPLITKEPPTPAQVLSALLILVGVWVGMFSGKEGTQEISLPASSGACGCSRIVRTIPSGQRNVQERGTQQKQHHLLFTCMGRPLPHYHKDLHCRVGRCVAPFPRQLGIYRHYFLCRQPLGLCRFLYGLEIHISHCCQPHVHCRDNNGHHSGRPYERRIPHIERNGGLHYYYSGYCAGCYSPKGL